MQVTYVRETLPSPCSPNTVSPGEKRRKQCTVLGWGGTEVPQALGGHRRPQRGISSRGPPTSHEVLGNLMCCKGGTGRPTRCRNSAARLPLVDSSMFITLVCVPKMLNFLNLDNRGQRYVKGLEL